jgi:hypothetical protein
VRTDPSPVTQTDPSIRPGDRIMIESAQDGFSARIERTVAAGGSVLSRQTFESYYAPSRNVYLVYGPPNAPSVAQDRPSA